MESLRLNKTVVTRIVQGHPWVYRNELPALPADFPAGELVELTDSKGRFVAIGYCNPKSVISVRILSREREKIDGDFFLRKIKEALSFRERFYAEEESYRVVYSEADLLPGLIVDRYGASVVIQILTAGMERHTQSIVAAIDSLLSPRAIVARNDIPSRALEGLAVETKVLYGALEPTAVISKNGLSFEIDLLEGQKTGFFLDQSENYLSLKGLVEGGEVLDTFCYTGGWSMHAAKFGAKSVVGIDASEGAVALARRNAARNGFESRCRFEVGNVFDLLKAQEGEGKQYDCIILDPPSFVKRRKEVENAVRGYKEINLRAMKLLRPGGFLVTCSCSYHLSEGRFREILLDASRDVRRTLRLISLRSQAKDHPVLLSLPETEYLKCAFLQVLP
ncbi:MAG: class I SAM-dependent rRNA methyltransferase [Candidatus Manganitrophaceae bacterium]|nr:MAG: class I SAM-dependent rRNA methyltransferase [Candidatus Manganitrophaceae bacterium]